jgi:polar amino acid transport system substrate-binding protein
MKALRLIILVCLLLLGQSALADETINITTGEYAPWTSEKLKHLGFSSHVISEAFKLEGYEVKFTFYPWKRVYEAAKSGDRFQASSWWYLSEERATEFHYSEPLLVDSTVFFHLKENAIPDWNNLDDLKGKRIGATAGYTYTPEFWEAAKSGHLDIQEASSDELNFKKLLKGRIDMFPTSDLVGQKLLKERFGSVAAESVTFHPIPLLSSPGHLLFSKKLPNGNELVSIFNRGLAKLRESGRYDQFWADLIAGNYDQ